MLQYTKCRRENQVPRKRRRPRSPMLLLDRGNVRPAGYLSSLKRFTISGNASADWRMISERHTLDEG